MTVLPDVRLREQARQLVGVPGIEAVTLGGSRARGDAVPTSDIDLGLYYRPPLDVAALGALARQVAGPQATVTEPGQWGPWVDGGGWLTIGGVAVDWLYRDLDRVQASWQRSRDGELTWHVQAGHPLGVPSSAYAAEAALAVVLADTTGELTRLHRATARYPPRLGEAVVAGLWEAGFLVDNAGKAAARADSAYVAGCLFRALLLCAHAVHARAGRWVTNEKGAVAAAGGLALAPARFAERVGEVFALAAPGSLPAAVDAGRRLVEDTVTRCTLG